VAIKSSRRWAEHEVNKEELINATKSVIRKPVWRLRRRLMNNIKMVLEDVRGVIVN
jgi:predicted phosphohydrolase